MAEERLGIPLWEIKQKISENNIPSPLIFIGEEYKLIDIYIKQIFKVKNEPYFSLDAVEDWIKLKNIKSLDGDDRQVACIKYDLTFFDKEPLWDKVEGLILVYLNIDKRKKTFLKRFKDNIVVFDKMDEPQILQALKAMCSQKKINLQDKYLTWLIQGCNNDYGRCINELGKFFIFPNADENLFKSMAKDDVFHFDDEEDAFGFCEQFILKKKEECLNTFNDIKKTKNLDSSGNFLGAISLLYSQIKNVMLVQTHPNPTEDSIGIKSNLINMAKYRKGRYKDNDLVEMMLQLSKLDREIKMGLVEDLIGLEQFLCRWL